MANRLAAETSPYLLQHKDNPVDWYAWGDEALQRAHERDVPAASHTAARFSRQRPVCSPAVTPVISPVAGSSGT